MSSRWTRGAGARSDRRAPVIAVSLALVLALLVAGCSSGDGGDEDRAGPPGDDRSGQPGADPTDPADSLDMVDPAADWQVADPEELGFDVEALEEIAARAEEGGSNCLLVTRKGRIVGEWYWNDGARDEPQEVFSATKSFSSTLVGIAQDRGELRIDEPASTYLTEWAGGPSAEVTIEDLLSNDSGREWSLGIDYGELIAAPDKDAFAIGLGQDHPRDEVWAYNNSAIQTLDAVLTRATGLPTAEFAQRHLLDRIGMADSSMTEDSAGNALTFMGLRSTCRDMARFGHLFLRGGEWNGEQVVSSEWVERATQPSQELSSAYGYLWWLNREGPLVSPTIATGGPDDAGGDRTGQLVKGAPESMYWARGLGGQMVQIDPGSETVAVRLGPSTVPEEADEFADEDLAAVVTDALTAGPQGG